MATNVPPDLVVVPFLEVPEATFEKWQSIVDTMAEVIGVPVGLVRRVVEGDLEVFVASKTPGNPFCPGDVASGSPGVYCHTVAQENRELMVPNALADEKWRDNPDAKLGMLSYLGFPIKWPDQRLFGTICVLDNKSNSYSEASRRLVRQFRDVLEGDLDLVYQKARRDEQETDVRRGALADADLRESEERVRLLVEHAADDFFLHDVNGRFLDVNQRACLSLGYSREELLTMGVNDLTDGQLSDLTSEEKKALWANMQPNTSATVLAHHRRKDGSIFPVEAHITCQLFRGQKIFLGLVRDITERVKAEQAIRQLNLELAQRVTQRTEALRESDARWQFALDGSGDGVWDWNVKTGRVFYSHQWKAMLGYEDHEIGESTDDWSDRIHPEDKERCWRTIEDHFKDNAPVFIMEHRMRAKDGSWRWILDRGKIVERTEDGEPLRVIGTHTDITERKQIEDRLAARERWLSEMVENLPQGAILVTGEDIHLNREAEKITGFQRHELSRRADWFQHLYREMHEQALSRYEADRSQGFGDIASVPFYRKDGQLRIAEFTAARVGEQDEVWLMQDVTEARQISQKLQESNEALNKAEKLAGIGNWSWLIESDQAVWSEALYDIFQRNPTLPAPRFEELRDIFTPESFAAFAKVAEQCVAFGTPYSIDLEGIRADGSRCFVNARGEAIWDDSKQRTVKVRGTLHDITERKTAENHIKALNERIQLAVEAGGIGIWTLDIATNISTADKNVARIYGLSELDCQQGIEASIFIEAIHPEDRQKARAELEMAIETGDPYRCRYRVLTPEGGLRWVISSAKASVGQEGKVTRLLGVIVDITDQMETASALAESRFQFKTLTETLPQIVWSSEADGRHDYFSARWSEFTGVEPEDITEDTWKALVFPEHWPMVSKAWNHARATGEPYDLDYRFRHRSGEYRWLRVMALPIRDETGQIIRWFGTSTDVHEAYLMAEALSKEKERVTLATKAGGVGIWEVDAASQVFQWDEQMHLLYGLRPGEFGGSIDEWAQRLHPDAAENILASWKKALSEESSFSQEYRIVHPTKGVRWLRVEAQIFRNPDGSPARAIGTNWDVTSEREAEEKLRAERHLLRTLIDHLPEVVFITDRDDRVKVANPALLSALQMPLDSELTGEKLHSFLPRESGERLWQETVAIMESGIPLQNHVERVALPHGDHKWARTSKIPWRDPEGNIIGIICFSADITDERATQQKIEKQSAMLAAANINLQEALSEAERHAQRAEASEHAKAEFLAVMSHEIRTPMNSVLGMVRLALQTELTSKQHNYLSKIDLSAKSLVAIINDILDFSKIEAGGMTLESAEFTIESLLESVSAVTAIRAEEKGLEIAFDVAFGIPEWVIGDSLRIGQVLINLINNAVKFTEKGEVVVTIAQEEITGNAQTLRFSVRDTGLGLEAEQIARLFQPFSQAEAHTSRKYGGTGLGLAICKRLVEMMGGRIWVESKPGEGSVFSFTIKTTLPATSPLPDIGKRAGLKERRILIVDDNASARGILVKMVEYFGMTVASADSGLAGLAILKEASRAGEPFEVVLMDWRMPEMDGLESARRIKSDPELKYTPAVLMVTAYAREEILQQAEQLRLEGVLIKPVTESVMFNTLMEAVGLPQVLHGPTRKKSASKDLTRLRGLRALVADDNAFNREVITEFLTQVGIIVEAVEDGTEAVTSLQTGDFDFVLLDMEMSGMGGLETARKLRQNARFQKLPILAMTGNVDAEAHRATREAGMDGHIDKPIDTETLYGELLRLCPAVPGQAMLAGKKVLVVDDNALNREVAEDFLALVGIETTLASNGHEALQCLGADTYDLVLMDVQMPEMDGLETTRAIRKLPHLVHLPIIALTAQAQEADREASLAAGMNAHLPKPIDEELLYRTIRHFLGVDITAPNRGETEQQENFPTALPGIDLSEAMRHLGGSRQHILRFLRGFVRDFNSAPEQLAQDLQDRNFEAIGFLSHTIKSVAAYLGAQEVAASAAKVEQAAKDNNEDAIATHVTDFRSHLQTVLGGITEYFSTDSPLVTGDSKSPVDLSGILPLMEKADPLIRKGNFEALSLLEEIRSRLSDSSYAALAETLYTQFEDVELEASTATLEKLREEILKNEGIE